MHYVIEIYHQCFCDWLLLACAKSISLSLRQTGYNGLPTFGEFTPVKVKCLNCNINDFFSDALDVKLGYFCANNNASTFNACSTKMNFCIF